MIKQEKLVSNAPLINPTTNKISRRIYDQIQRWDVYRHGKRDYYKEEVVGWIKDDYSVCIIFVKDGNIWLTYSDNPYTDPQKFPQIFIG